MPAHLPPTDPPVSYRKIGGDGNATQEKIIISSSHEVPAQKNASTTQFVYVQFALLHIPY
jgi:hypothetical protein